jgi:hypothetical protein
MAVWHLRSSCLVSMRHPRHEGAEAGNRGLPSAGRWHCAMRQSDMCTLALRDLTPIVEFGAMPFPRFGNVVKINHVTLRFPFGVSPHRDVCWGPSIAVACISGSLIPTRLD